MKNYFSRLSLLILSVAVLGISMQSCKKKFDEPPVGEYPSLVANATIAEIQGLHTIGNTASEITEDKIIEAIVVSSDEAGNFYKQLIIQDSTGGVELRVETSNLYNNYPVGRKVYVRCQGLFVGDYEGNHQLTINENGDRIPEGLLESYVVAGAPDQPLTPKVVTISDLASTTMYRNMLIQLDNVQFITADTNQTYADAVGQQSGNRTLQDCNGNIILVRSSGYCDFAGDLTPGGAGSIVAVHSNFGSDKQLYIRDTDDLDFNSTRCSSSSNVGGNLISIATLRGFYTGAAGSAPVNSKIKGYVISDRSTGNIVDKNVVIMDENQDGGILVRFAAAHTLDLGDYVEFAVDGGTLSEYNQLLQLEGLNEANFAVLATGVPVPPITITLANLLADAETYESTLVKLENVNITGDATFGFNEISDGTDIIDLYTSSFATFSGDAVPTDCQDVTGIVGQFNADYQLTLRNPSADLASNTGCSGGSGGGGSGNETLIGLDSVRILFAAGNTTMPGDRKISGVIISDGSAGNIFGDNFVIQDATGGIQVRMTANHSYALGDSVEIVITGASLGESSSTLRLGNTGGIASSAVTVISTGVTPSVRVATVSDLLANGEAWESTLIQIQSATVGGGSGNYGFNTVTDASGTIDMYTASAANYHGSAYPTGTVTVTAIMGEYNNTFQVKMRNGNDVQ